MADVLDLLLGSVLAVSALAFVLAPILRGAAVTAAPRRDPDVEEASALDALREIEFDRATGKLSAEDYDTLRARYAPRAVEELRSRDADPSAGAAVVAPAVAGGASDAAEALIARAKAMRGHGCPTHGPRPESDALFCSDCGRFLGTSCLSCGAAVDSDTARFCAECGASLGA